MIITRLMGGIGNQMFQYAAGRRLAYVHRTELKLDLSWFSNKAAIDTARTYDLDVFNIQASFAAPAEIEMIANASLFSRLGRLNRLAPQFLKRRYVREKHHHFDPSILCLPDTVYLDGYWQSERYFTDIEKAIRKDFEIRMEPDDVNKRMADEITKAGSISVHVRRGDYVSNPETIKYHGTCSPHYYKTAVEIISTRLQNPHFFIFSDDPDWVRSNMHWISPMTVVDLNRPEKGYEDMRLMSQCKHHIIANSSFSWWGAWLCANPDKIVIAPRQWFRNASIDSRDVVPGSWMRI